MEATRKRTCKREREREIHSPFLDLVHGEAHCGGHLQRLLWLGLRLFANRDRRFF